MNIRVVAALLLIPFFLTSCYRAGSSIDPNVCSPIHPKQIEREQRCSLSLPSDFSISPFPPLTAEELMHEWGKELQIGLTFAADFDLYRAITSFKRAKILLVDDNFSREQQIEYCIALAYFLGKKYQETLYTIESTSLSSIDPTFPAFSDLLLILYDSYTQLDKPCEADYVLSLIEQDNLEYAEKLVLKKAIATADFEQICENGKKKAYLNTIISNYGSCAKSVRKAEMLNALLPGSGYWYIGQRHTAVTALLVNALFIGATAHFFANGNIAAGCIALSLESGWYFGGIYGAGLGAKTYNEKLYESYALKVTQKERFFPLMMLEYSF